MKNMPVLLGMTVAPPVVMLFAGTFIAASIPRAIATVRCQGWRISLTQLMIGTIPIALFAWGIALHWKSCEMVREFDSELEGAAIDPLLNLLTCRVCMRSVS